MAKRSARDRRLRMIRLVGGLFVVGGFGFGILLYTGSAAQSGVPAGPPQVLPTPPQGGPAQTPTAPGLSSSGTIVVKSGDLAVAVSLSADVFNGLIVSHMSQCEQVELDVFDSSGAATAYQVVVLHVANASGPGAGAQTPPPAGATASPVSAGGLLVEAPANTAQALLQATLNRPNIQLAIKGNATSVGAPGHITCP